MNTWYILMIIGVICLIISFKTGRNGVWGGATGGLIVGLVLGFFLEANYWHTVGKSVVVGCLIGIASELLALVGSRVRRKK